MKKKILILFILIINCLFATSSYAKETGTVYIESNYDVVEKGDEIEITVNLKDATTAALDFSLYFDNDKWDYVSKIENTKVENNNIVYVWYDKSGGKSPKKGEIVKFKFKAKDNGLSTFSLNGNFYNESAQMIQIDFKEKQVKIGKEDTNSKDEEESGTDTKESNANLQVLRLDVAGITPLFDNNVYEYYLTVPNTVKDIEVIAIGENSNAKIDVTGNKNLKEGLNNIKILVTSEDNKNKKTYNIKVTKTANLELANTNLEILAIENALLNPPFNVDETNYSTEVSKDTEKLNILAIPENENAKVQILGNDNLNEGDNAITIIVTAENGFSEKKFQINVHRRNEEEQIKYEEEQKEQEKKLEEAYEIEKVSSEIKENEPEENLTNGAIWIIVVIVIIVIVCVTVFWYLKYKKNRK